MALWNDKLTLRLQGGETAAEDGYVASNCSMLPLDHVNNHTIEAIGLSYTGHCVCKSL